MLVHAHRTKRACEDIGIKRVERELKLSSHPIISPQFPVEIPIIRHFDSVIDLETERIEICTSTLRTQAD
jgi:hypothetical protein